MADIGFSPPTRIFEAAGAAACVITDRWRGIETFFAPGQELLVAASAEDVVQHLRTCGRGQTRSLGRTMRQRALREHTYRLRARKVDAIVAQSAAPPIPVKSARLVL
jgi:spore maturation protein CgeB